MTNGITRRRFLALSAGAAALALDGCGDSDTCIVGADGKQLCALPQSTEAPFDTVVVLMMSSRSFDHVLGWLPGANGRALAATYADVDGISHAPFPLAPDFQGCAFADPDHSWPGVATQYASGRCDGFLKTAKAGDRYPIGYYTQPDLPVLSTLATNYTTYDNYFCSMMGPARENRLYQLTGTTQLGMPEAYPATDAERPCLIDTAIFDRVRAAGLTTAYYYHGEPITGLFRSKRYDNLALPIDRLWSDAQGGRLANVVFVDPDSTNAADGNGTANDAHHPGSVQVAEQFIARVYNAMKDGLQWGRMVFVLNFDGHGGFFDHVPPPSCEDDTVLTGAGPFPDLKRLGFRVPAIVISPFAPKKIETAGPYEHASVLKMIEWRWDLAPLTARDRTAKNLADALDFKVRRDPVGLPAFTAPPAVACGS